MDKKDNKTQKIKKPRDKRKFVQSIIIIIMIIALLLSVGATLIYNLIYYMNQ